MFKLLCMNRPIRNVCVWPVTLCEDYLVERNTIWIEIFAENRVVGFRLIYSRRGAVQCEIDGVAVAVGFPPGRSSGTLFETESNRWRLSVISMKCGGRCNSNDTPGLFKNERKLLIVFRHFWLPAQTGNVPEPSISQHSYNFLNMKQIFSRFSFTFVM